MGEFELIQHYFASQASVRDDVELGIGDDCALLNIPAGECLAVTTDSLVSGIHFFADIDPFALGHKVLAVNLSDLAAMGAYPRWVSLAITLPEANESWLAEFARGFHALATKHNVALIGGDTTRGPLSVTVSAKGTVPARQALRRSGAKAGDAVYISGSLGAAALAVQQRIHNLHIPDDALQTCQQRMDYPQPRCELGLALRDIASSALDLSDGLSGDLMHILRASGVAAEIELSTLPVDPAVVQSVTPEQALQLALGGGDDYELCFTVPAEHENRLHELATSLTLPLTRIGAITAGTPHITWYHQGKPVELHINGWEHFHHGETGKTS
ncbi:thiamine-phosphate kinase [Tolumonas osonensis]|uniref:Thiamine-monophosphate kinase n=1 Tax=Tolumonas osonensis TaxID=675874 RepID=A0A841GIL9_9GAMM|nr:thiamine-phosphate kinase [Tolumonas osonensis]MBB6055071.1 thiamine-monophosphate kinase [Tolumonas osonensis]